MSCPDCRQPLEEIEYEGVLIRTCGGCGGEFIGADELGHIVRTREERFPGVDAAVLGAMVPEFGGLALDPDRQRRCPDCAEPMTSWAMNVIKWSLPWIFHTRGVE